MGLRKIIILFELHVPTCSYLFQHALICRFVRVACPNMLLLVPTCSNRVKFDHVPINHQPFIALEQWKASRHWLLSEWLWSIGTVVVKRDAPLQSIIVLLVVLCYVHYRMKRVETNTYIINYKWANMRGTKRTLRFSLILQLVLYYMHFMCNGLKTYSLYIRPRYNIHCQYWKSIMYINYIHKLYTIFLVLTMNIGRSRSCVHNARNRFKTERELTNRQLAELFKRDWSICSVSEFWAVSSNMDTKLNTSYTKLK